MDYNGWREDDRRRPDSVALKKVKRRVYDVLLVLESAGVVTRAGDVLEICPSVLNLMGT